MKLFALSLVFLTVSARAMYGDLLPMDLAPNHACHVSLDNGQSTCSGTIMSSGILKTASHCLRGKKLEETKVICPNGQEFKVKELIMHPDYYNIPNRMLADVGLIVLDGEYKDEIPGFLDERGEIADLMKISPLCAVWGYGYNIKSIRSLGSYHGVALNEFYFDDSHVVIPNSHEVMIRSGDSGGGLFCLDGDDNWVNVATVYGHDYQESYLLRNDYIRPFLQANGLESKPHNKNPSSLKAPSYSAPLLTLGQEYKVRTFSSFGLNGEEAGIGDQTQVNFIPDRIDGEYATGILTVNDLAPTRYLCADNILCYGSYQNVTISARRLIPIR